MRTVLRNMFAAATNVRNYRLFIIGQAISQIGGWIQIVAQGWLVLKITGSPGALGTVAAVQTLPVLLFSPYAGVIVDRVDKRKLLIWVQVGCATMSTILGTLVLTDVVRLWQVYLLAGCVGMIRCFDNPARQSFVHEIVSGKYLHNAVTLNSIVLNTARVVGPSIAGTTIVLGGLGICFLLNAASFLAVVVALLVMRTAELDRSVPARRAKLIEGLNYVRRTPALAVPLAMTGIVGCLAFEWPVVLPVVAERVLHGDARTYGFLTAAMGIGAIVGGLGVSAMARTGMRMLVVSSSALGVTVLVASVAPNLVTMLVCMAAVGAATISMTATSNSTLQLTAAPQMRGRVMALWAVGMMGSTAIGAPIVGFAMEHFGARSGLVIGGVSCLGAAALGAVAVFRNWTGSPADALPDDAGLPADAPDAALPVDAATGADSKIPA